MGTTGTPLGGHAADHETERRAIVREAVTMGLYIAVSLLSVLLTVPATESRAAAIGLVWGSTVGFTLAHWLAFQLSARIYAGAHLERHDRKQSNEEACKGDRQSALCHCHRSRLA